MKVTNDALLQMSLQAGEAYSYTNGDTLVIADRSLVTLVLKNNKWCLSSGNPSDLGSVGQGFYTSVLGTDYPHLTDEDLTTKERTYNASSRKNRSHGYNSHLARQVSIRFNDGTDIVLPSLKDTVAYLNTIGPVSMSSVGRWASGETDTYLTRYSYLGIYSITYK